MATAFPFGLIGCPTTVTLASKSLKSVSRTGLDAQNLSPLSRLSMLIRLSTSLSSTMRLVLHLMCEFSPSMPFRVTCTLFLEQGASM